MEASSVADARRLLPGRGPLVKGRARGARGAHLTGRGACARLAGVPRHPKEAIVRHAIVLALALLLAAPAAAQGRKGAKGPKSVTPAVTVTKLKNGLTLVTVPTAAPGLVGYYTLMRVGSRNEVEPGHTGFAHFFEHMMFFGTEKWPREKWEATQKQLGLNSSGYTWMDMTVFHSTGPTKALPTIIETDADRLQHLTYSEAGFQTEAKAVLGEYLKNNSNPIRRMYEVLSDKAFDQHTYKHTTMGFLADIKAMPAGYEYSKQFFTRFYRPDNAVIFVVGEFDAAEVQRLVKHEYASWTGKADDPKIPAEPAPTAERRAHVDFETPTMPRWWAGYRTPAASVKTKDSAVQHVIAGLLFGQQSPLYRDLVLDRQLCAGLRGSAQDHRDPHLFSVIATARAAASLPEIERTIDAAIDEVRQGKIDATKLAAVQSNLRYSMLMELETPDDLAGMLAAVTAATGDPQGLEKLIAQVDKVTAKDVVAFAKTYLGKERRTVVTLTGKKGGAR
jgi:zinc protease